MNEALSLIHLRTEFLSTCEPEEIEIKLLAHKIQWWGGIS